MKKVEWVYKNRDTKGKVCNLGRYFELSGFGVLGFWGGMAVV